MPVVQPPQLIGVHDVARLFGVSADRIRRRVRAGHEPTLFGYLGKVSGRHTWNAHELMAHMFRDRAGVDDLVRSTVEPGDPVEPGCIAEHCDDVAQFAGLCARHLRRFMTSWRHAESSSLVLMQFVGMCRWIVDRNEHLVLPHDFDPFDTVCMTPDCGNDTNVHSDADAWHGPLCRECSARFWNNSPLRPRPPWWKDPKRKVA